MTSPNGLQSNFLEEVRSRLAPNLSLADELAELLSISRDSAYRRIRGETVLSLDEVKILCAHYSVSMDELLAPSTDMVSFQLRALNATDFTFEKWLRSLLANIETVASFPDGKIIWHAKDLPIFHYFQYPRLAAFKMYFWMKSFTRDAKYATGKYSHDLITRDLLALAEKVWRKYAAQFSAEIINYEILNVTLRHIEFAHECGLFHDKEIGRELCDDCVQLLHHLKAQAELGEKRTFGETGGGGKFELYLDEMLIGDNTVLMKMGGRKLAIITHNNFNLLTTAQKTFCAITENHMNNMFSKSTLISSTAERERNKFFNKLEAKVQEVRVLISRG